MKANNLKNFFLVAMPSLKDPNFSRAVVLIYEHTNEGAIGLVINKPLQITLNNVLDHLDIKTKDDVIGDHPVFMGGPVGQEHGFIIHKASDDKEPVSGDELIISASKETLKSIASGKGPHDFIVTLGYAGWEKGQLEKEIERNDWLIVPFDSHILFDINIDKRWSECAKLLGIDINQLSTQVGHG